jgi:hypothetical protein
LFGAAAALAESASRKTKMIGNRRRTRRGRARVRRGTGRP